jgi:hypothetical protein
MEHNRKLARWWMLLQEFDYRIEYVPGKANVVADCLSRMTCNVEEVKEEDSLGTSVPIALTVLEEATCDDCGH